MKRGFGYTALIFFIFITQSAFAFDEDEVTEEEIFLEAIVVTPGRTPQPIGKISENVSVITREELNKLSSFEVSEVLEYVTGVGVSKNGGTGRVTSLSIQGSRARDVKFMIDGIPFNSQTSGQANASQVSLESIERIEIVRGPSSSIWGSGAGAVINIITRQPKLSAVPEIAYTFSRGEFHTDKDSLSVTGGLGDSVGYLVTASLLDEGGFRDKSDILQKRAFGKITFLRNELIEGLFSFGYNGSDMEDFEYPSLGTFRQQDYIIRYTNLAFSSTLNDKIKLDLSFKGFDRHLQTRTFDIGEENPSSHSRSRSKFGGIYFKSDISINKNTQLLLGADFGWDILKSTSLFKVKDVNYQAPYFRLSQSWGQFEVSAGGRYDSNEEYGSEFSPALGVVYKTPFKTLIRFNIAEGFNAPPLLWRFLSSATTAPNPDLAAENSLGFEFGIESQPLDFLWTKLALYRMDVEDAIIIARNSEGKRYRKNSDKERRQGVEFDMRIQPFKWLHTDFGAAFNDVEDRGTKQTVRGRPRALYNIGVGYENKKLFSADLRGKYVWWFAEPDYRPRDRRFIWDIHCETRKLPLRKFGEGSLFLNGYNITNIEFWQDNLLPYPRRSFEAGFKLKW